MDNGDFLLSDEDFIDESNSDLKEGDSADDDCDINDESIEQNTVDSASHSLDEPTELINQEQAPVLPQIRSERNYNWSTHRPQIPNISFSETSGLKIFPKLNEPFNYFKLYITSKFRQFLIDEANAYGVEIFLNNESPNSRILDWNDTDVTKIKKFIILLFHTGTMRLSRIENHWKTNDLFDFHIFRNTMSRNQFTLLLRVLHFCQNPG